MFRSKSSFPLHKQLDAMDCGPACLKMVAEYYGKKIDFKEIKRNCYLTKQGVSFSGMMAASEKMGMETMPIKVSMKDLMEKVDLPCIAHWNNNHFIVIYKISKNRIYIADPKYGILDYGIREFEEGWLNKANKEGSLLLIEPRKEFYDQQSALEKHTDIHFLKSYFKPYRKLIFQLFLGILVTSLIQLTFPFLTQSLVDYGIKYQDLHFVYLILIAQIVFFISAGSINMLRNWILLHITARISIKLISDFLSKLLKLPIAYFQTKQKGDLLQRIYDHDRIETFLSSETLSVAFGMLNIILFSAVLAYYNLTIFVVFLIGTFIYILWSLYFMKQRAYIDLIEFQQNSRNQSSLYQLLSSITEIKLNGSEQRRKMEWKTIQYKLFNISMKGLVLHHKQMHGGLFLNEMKNILILFIAATSVIDGTITLGVMLAIQYILGQLNGPINSFVDFFIVYQEAVLSIKRLAEIHDVANECDLLVRGKMDFQDNEGIELRNLSYRYGPPESKMVLQNINLLIPSGKVTAIVGPSGSGKTTLMKLLLKFYEPIEGDIYFGKSKLETYDTEFWRSNCGVVMQNGFIFNDSMKNNITESDSKNPIDLNRLDRAIEVANLKELISDLPNNMETILGSEGSLLSGGERQRVLIARAIYKNPRLLFFDEATSSLDSSNEKRIMNELNKFFKERTVVVIAHRLSTVKNADQIVVLDQSKISEIGTHKELVALKGKYFELVKNQL